MIWLLDDRAAGSGVAEWPEVTRTAHCRGNQRHSERKRHGKQVCNADLSKCGSRD